MRCVSLSLRNSWFLQVLLILEMGGWEIKRENTKFYRNVSVNLTVTKLISWNGFKNYFIFYFDWLVFLVPISWLVQFRFSNLLKRNHEAEYSFFFHFVVCVVFVFFLFFLLTKRLHRSSAWHQIILQLIEDKMKERERECLVWFGHIVIEINRNFANEHSCMKCFQSENLT